MKRQFVYVAALLAAVLLLMLVSGILGGLLGYQKGKTSFKMPDPDTLRIEHWNTTYIPSPPDTVTKEFTKVVKVPLYVPGEEKPSVDSTWAVLTYEQHFARLDSVADVWVSGYDVKFDSARVYKHTVTEIIRQPYEVMVPKEPVLTLDVGIGNHQWQTLDPYVFAKATVKIDRWKIEPYVGYTYSKQPMAGVGVSWSFVIVH